MRIIGITGGMGSGKSKVLDYLQEQYHTYVIQLDEVAKMLYKKGQTCHQKVIELFGTDVLDEEGEISIPRLRSVVFGNEPNRLKLHAVVHPEVKRWVIEDITRKRMQGVSLYVIEAALLIEDKYSEICDTMWYIYVDANVRIKRLQESRGLSSESILAIMKTQQSPEEYRIHCDITIDNSGDFKDTMLQLDHHIKQEIEEIHEIM